MQEGHKQKKARVTKRREVRPHAELWHTANCLLDAGQREPTASAHQLRASLVFRPFALEAFLNWLGQYVVPHWKYLERLKPKDKLELLADLIGVKPDYGLRPWQIMRVLFGFRNDIAHGKPEILEKETLESLDDFLDAKLGERLETTWEQFCTEENAVKAKEDVYKIAEALYVAADMKKKQMGPHGPFAAGFHIHGAGI